MTGSAPSDNRGSQLRILTVANVPPDPNSGAAGTVYATNEAFRELGHEVDEIWADRLGPRRIAHGNLHSLLEQPRAYRREVAKAVASNDYDVVMISQPQGYLAARFLKQNGFRGVVINRSHGLELRVEEVLPEWHRRLGVPESRRPGLTRFLKPWLYRQWTEAGRWFDGFVLPSVDDQECLERRMPHCQGRAVTIHHGIPQDFLTTPLQQMTLDRQKRLLYVGQYAFIKGPDVLADVVNQCLQKDPSLSMTWVTSVHAHEEILGRLNQKVRSRVELKPWCNQSELLPLLDNHGIFLFPSLFEGAGKACAEALARGLFVVASDTGGMRDHLKHLQPEGLCPVGDATRFIHAVLQFSKCPLDSDLANCRANAVRACSWRACAENLTVFFRALSKEQFNDQPVKVV